MSGVDADPAVDPPVVQLGKGELQQRERARLRRGLGDEVGDDRFVNGHAGPCGGQGDGVTELRRRHRREHERAGTDVSADAWVLQRPVEHVGADGGHEPHVLVLVDEAGDDVDELGASVGVSCASSSSSSWSITTTRGPDASTTWRTRVVRSAALRRRLDTSSNACAERGGRVVAGHHRDDGVAGRPQPRHETGPHQRALARPGCADDGDQTTTADRLLQRIDDGVTPEELGGVGFVERA